MESTARVDDAALEIDMRTHLGPCSLYGLQDGDQYCNGQQTRWM